MMAENFRLRHIERQAQVPVDDFKSLQFRTTKARSFDTQSERVTGSDICFDGTVILTDYSYKAMCFRGFDSRGSHSFSFSTAPFDAYDITSIDDITLAVTSGNKIISIIDISSGIVKKCITVGYKCYGITHKNGTLFVCAAQQGVLSIDLRNEKTITIMQCDLPLFSLITSHQDKLYYTNNASEVVTCCDTEGNTLWTSYYHAPLGGLHGITTDNEGQGFVCDSYMNTVVVFFNDGKQHKTIVFAKDGLCCPNSLHFDKYRGNLLVANNKQSAVMFHRSYLNV